MAQVITIEPENDSPDGHPRARLVRLNDTHRTSQQCQILASILAECRQVVDSRTDIGTTYEIDPRVREAAAKTYEIASLQLRNVLDEQSRWLLRDSDGDRYSERLAEANLKVAQVQEKLIQERLRPCISLGATLRQVIRQDNGEKVWLAFVGSVPNPDGLIGAGDSPEQAMLSFDKSYQQHLERIEAEPESLPPEKPLRKRKQKT